MTDNNESGKVRIIDKPNRRTTMNANTFRKIHYTVSIVSGALIANAVQPNANALVFIVLTVVFAATASITYAFFISDAIKALLTADTKAKLIYWFEGLFWVVGIFCVGGLLSETSKYTSFHFWVLVVGVTSITVAYQLAKRHK